MADVDSVAAARKRVAAAYKDWLKETYETQLSEMGSKKTRPNLPAIDEFGAWADTGHQSKPLAWILEFDQQSDGSWTVSRPPSNYPNRIGGSFNSRSPLQGVLSRILPVVRVSENPRRCEQHEYWEWAMALVFPGRPTFRTTGTSGGVIEFDPVNGVLTSRISERDVHQPYVEAALFKLVPEDEQWSPEVNLTYGEATEALARFVHVEYALPEPRSEDEDA